MENNTLNRKIWHGRFFRYVPLILCICLILFASTTNASTSNTSRFIRPLLEFLFPNAPEAILNVYHGYIRKFAHFTEYALLAFFASRAFWHSGKEILRQYWYLFALAIVLFVASIDEVNQSFDVTRTGSISDVLLDCLGGLVMISFLICFKFVSRGKKAPQ